MGNWALTIGIDQYQEPVKSLCCAVRDAIRMAGWLTDVNGGAVPPRNLFLLLARTGQSPPAPLGLQLMGATQDDILTAIDALITRSGGRGENFYFYFSGHGISARKDFYEENAIVPSDFSVFRTDKAISMRSIFEHFKGTCFQKQFFIVDACRNLPWKDEYRISDYPRGSQLMLPVPPQYVMYATSPGTKAVEVSEQGAFTGALLEALSGAGIAKEWDDNAQEYVLHWDSVFRQVRQDVEVRRLAVGEGLIQTPRQAGEHSDENPELGRLAPDLVAEVPLEVFLDPENIAPRAEVVVGHIGGEVERRHNIEQLPVRFLLKPRPYSVRAIAPGYQTERPYYPVQLYSPSRLPIRLSEVESAEVLQPDVMEAQLTKGLGGSQSPGFISVHNSDELARLELVDSSGLLLGSEDGHLLSRALVPGFYRARLVSPEGQLSEQLIELHPGENVEVQLSAQLQRTQVFDRILSTNSMSVNSDNTIDTSEALGPITSANLSTLLALAGGAANEETHAGHRLRQLGVEAFGKLDNLPVTSGIQVLFGVESDEPYQATDWFLTSTRVQVWGQRDAVPSADVRPIGIPSQAGLAQYAWAKPPGSYWLSIETPGQRPIAFAVTVLPNRLSLFVFVRRVDDAVDIFQYLPALEPGPLDYPDPRRDIARFPVLQRSELVQRAYLAGRLEQARRATDLLYAKWVEPIAGVLGGYIQLRIDPSTSLLAEASSNMALYFGELSDSHVLRAKYQESSGSPSAAVESYRKALERGLPIMQEGLTYLLDGASRHGIEHSWVEWMRHVNDHRVRGLLWTAIPVEKIQAR